MAHTHFIITTLHCLYAERLFQNLITPYQVVDGLESGKVNNAVVGLSGVVAFTAGRILSQ